MTSRDLISWPNLTFTAQAYPMARDNDQPAPVVHQHGSCGCHVWLHAPHDPLAFVHEQRSRILHQECKDNLFIFGRICSWNFAFAVSGVIDVVLFLLLFKIFVVVWFLLFLKSLFLFWFCCWCCCWYCSCYCCFYMFM